MIGQQAVDLLKARVQRATNASSAFTARVETEFSLAQQRLERFEELPWFLLRERSYLQLTLGEERAILPDGFLRENEDDDLQVFDLDDSSWHTVEKSTLDKMRLRWVDGTLGLPRKYDITGTYFRLKPAPDKATYRLYMTYYGKAAPFTLETENDWLREAPDLLIAEAGIPIAQSIGNDKALALFQSQRTQELDRIGRENTAREQANLDPNPEN